VIATERAPGGRLGRLVLAALAFGLLAPVGLVTVPLALLTLLARPGGARELATIALAGGFSLWWLLQPGTIADQVARAAAVIGSAAFVAATRLSRSSLTHRALLAASAAAVVLAILFLAGPWTWADVRFWVAHRTGFAVRVVLAPVWAAAGGQAASTRAAVMDLEQWLSSSVRIVADHYAAIVALQLVAGLALAWAIHRRVARAPLGEAAGRFRDFRFTEHLGWLGVTSLGALLIPQLAAAKLAAANLLVVTGALYALRGLAVATFGLTAAGGAGAGTVLLITLATLFILPAVVAGTIILGLLDAGLDLRKRMVARRAD
jgi:hypothetical protein